MGSPILAAIDQGYGWNKSVCMVGNDVVYRDAFPAIAMPPPADVGQYGGSMHNLRVQIVDTGSRRFLCGHDVTQFADPLNNDRQRTADYAMQEGYYAMYQYTLGDIRRVTGQSEIDLLVAGLPLSSMHLKEALRAKLEGKHRVHAKAGERGDPFVQVRRVEIVPQPGGALHAAAEVHPQIENQKNLVLDFGYFTLDYMLATGKRPFPPRCGAVPGGFSGYLDAVNDAVAAEIAKANPARHERFFMPHHLYEAALKGDGKLATRSGPIDLAAASEAALGRIDHYIDVMLSTLMSTQDVVNVVFAGGGAPFMRRCFVRRYPDMTNLFDMPDPQYAIVDGYLLLAKKIAAGAAR